MSSALSPYTDLRSFPTVSQLGQSKRKMTSDHEVLLSGFGVKMEAPTARKWWIIDPLIYTWAAACTADEWWAGSLSAELSFWNLRISDGSHHNAGMTDETSGTPQCSDHRPRPTIRRDTGREWEKELLLRIYVHCPGHAARGNDQANNIYWCGNMSSQ